MTKVDKLQKELDEMLKAIDEVNKDSKVHQLEKRIFHLEFLTGQAATRLHGISDLVEVMGFYVGDDDPRLEGSLGVLNNLILEVWSDLKEEK